MVWTFLPIAALLTIAPGPATAMVVRNALRTGWRSAVLTVAGNEVGARQSFLRSRLARWLERTTGAVLVALGARVALDQR